MVVFRTQIGMVGVNEGVKVVFELGFELSNGFLKFSLRLFALVDFFRHLADFSHFIRHRFCHLRVTESPNLLQAGNISVFLARHMLEQVAAIDNLINGLLKGDGHPLVFAPLACPLQNFSDAVGVVNGLQSCLSFRAQRSINLRKDINGRVVRQVREHRLWRKRVSVYLDCYAVQQLHLDAAARIALQADGINDVFGLGKRVI